MNIGTLTVLLTANTIGLNKANLALGRMQRTSQLATAAMSSGLDDVSRQLVSVGRSLTTYVSLPLGLIAAKSVKTFAEFEFHLAKIEGLVGVAHKQTQAWGDEILKLSVAVGKGPNELADALYFVTSSGFKGAEAMGILEVSAKAAAAGLGETKYVADIITSAMSAYGKANLSAAEATDILVATIREGKGEADKMVASMGVALPVASKLGVGMDEVGAAMASMTRSGTTVATSAVQVRQMFNTLMKPSKQAEEHIKKLGSSYGELRDILAEEGLLAMLKKVTDLTGGNAASMARLFPNIRALNGVLELTGKNADEVAKIFEELANATGATETAFDIAAKTTKFKLDQALSRLQVMMVGLGRVLKEMVLPALDAMLNLFEWIGSVYNSMAPGGQAVVHMLGMMAFAIGPLILLMEGLVAVWRAFILVLNLSKAAMASNPIGLLLIALATAYTAYLAWTGVTKAQTKAEADLNREMAKQNNLLSARETTLNKLGLMKVEGNTAIGFKQNRAMGFTAEKMAINAINKMDATELTPVRMMLQKEIKAMQKELENFKPTGERPIDEEWFVRDLKASIATYETVVKHIDSVVKADENLMKSIEEATQAQEEAIKSLKEYGEEMNLIVLKQQMFGKTYDKSSDLVAAYQKRLDFLAKTAKSVTPEMQALADKIMNIQSAMMMKPMATISWKETLEQLKKPNRIQQTIMDSLKDTPFEFDDRGKIKELFKIDTSSYAKDGEKVNNINKTLIISARDLFEALSKGGSWSDALRESLLSTATLQAALFEQIKNGVKAMADSLLSIFSSLGEGIGNALAGAENPFDVLVESLLATVKTLGKILIGLGGLLLLINPGLGAALLLAGVGVTALGQYGSVKFEEKRANAANGGIVPAGYPNDTYKANLTSQEAIIPLDRLPQVMGLNQGKREPVEFFIEGRHLKAILEDAQMMGGIM